MKKCNSRSKIKTHWGFPVAGKQGSRGRRGISLMVALLAIALMMGFAADLITSSAVNLELAGRGRDRIKAKFLAKSGEKLALFLVMIGWGVDLTRAQGSTPKAMAKPLSDDNTSIWGMLNGLPPFGASSVELLRSGAEAEEDPFGLKGIFSTKLAEQMALFEDSFVIKVEDEGAKINVNNCRVGRCNETIAQLIALFSCPVEKQFLENRNLSPEELAYRIKDFISSASGTSEQSGYSDKNTPYQKANPPYETKGMPFDSLDELLLVEGWDDDIHKVFSPFLTIFPIQHKGRKESKININTAKRELISCLIPQARDESCRENFELKFAKIQEKKQAILMSGKNIDDTLKDLTCFESNKKRDSKENPLNWFSGRSDVHRITIESETGVQRIKLVTLIRKIMPGDKNPLRARLESKRAYQRLFWQLR